MALFYVHQLPANMQWHPEPDQAEASAVLDVAVEQPVAPA